MSTHQRNKSPHISISIAKLFFAQRTVLSYVDLTYWNGKVAHMGRITNLGNLGLHLPERSGRFLNLLEPLLHFVELLLLCTRTGQQ